MLSFIFLIPSIVNITLIKLTHEVLFLASLRELDVGTSIVLKEEVLILGIGINPFLQLRLMDKPEVSLSFQVLAIASHENLLEVSVIKDVWVHCPSTHFTLVVITGEAEGI